MNSVVFMYSGEGTRSSESHYKLLATSPKWREINTRVQEMFDVELEEIWNQEGSRSQCPYSPLLTVAGEICLSDLWRTWGYEPIAVLGHSVGELTASYMAGFYSLDKILRLSYDIGCAAANIEGSLFHGFLTEKDLAKLRQRNIHLASRNFTVDGLQHVTVCSLLGEDDHITGDFPGLTRMSVVHPWHHPDYRNCIGSLDAHGCRQSLATPIFSSGVTGGITDSLQQDHWQRWLTGTIDFVGAVLSLAKQLQQDPLEIIEIGFHPVLEQCCRVFTTSTHVSSMYRGEDEYRWILNQRQKLDQRGFKSTVTSAIETYMEKVDLTTSLAYQGFSSINFVELTGILGPYFPDLVPQDFYRYKTIEQLINHYGMNSVRCSEPSVRVQKNKVVVAGMSCKFPISAENPHQFWEQLRGGGDLVFSDPERGDFEAGFLNSHTTKFDHEFFNIADAEAKTMDPQQILALELTELLWQDAGIDPATLDRRRVGVYIGAWNEEYQGDKDSVYYPTGTNPSIIASRISYHYDLRGPSWVANTACSSSLLAVHYGCKDIEAGRIDYAIAGGVNMILGNSFTHNMRDAGFLSSDGRCKTFDNSANGYVRGEGGGLILLVRKGLVDKCYADVLGSAINQNGGRAQLITAPHPEAQEELILDACEDAAISPSDIGYLECHGTGTKIGDPIEISALQSTVAKNRQDDCYLGSVKSNIGHLESAAGIAGLIKSLLILNHGIVPANLHFHTPNKYIDFASHRLRVVDQETEIDPLAKIGVSSFGFGGVNSHVIVAGVVKDLRKSVEDRPSPFDRDRARPLSQYYSLEQKDGGQRGQTAPDMDESLLDVEDLVLTTYFELTGIKEIDPAVEITDQGLDSMSATQFVASLQEKLQLEIDVDVLFDYPILEQLVMYLKEKMGLTASSEVTGQATREEVAEKVARIFFELTNIKDIDPDLGLTDQGLDSMSGTQFVSQLSSELQLEIDSDILFDHPLYDQLVDELSSSYSTAV